MQSNIVTTVDFDQRVQALRGTYCSSNSDGSRFSSACLDVTCTPSFNRDRISDQQSDEH